MIAKTQAGRLKLVSTLRHSVVVMGAVFLVSAGILAAEIVLKNRKAEELRHQDSLVQQQTRSLDGELERANRVEEISVPSDLSAVAKLQSSVEKTAAQNKTSVIEFRASSEVTQYLTRFAKTSTASGWGQVEVQMSLSGTAKHVAATLAGLIDSNVPFEFDSLDIARDKVDSLGDATVIGHATLRVLIKTAKEVA